jgi:hypothetical protein
MTPGNKDVCRGFVFCFSFAFDEHALIFGTQNDILVARYI